MIKSLKKRSLFIISTVLVLIIALSFAGGLFGVFGSGEKYVAYGGESEYKIVISASADGTERNAARELQFFFEKATGAKLPIVSDEGKGGGGKYFSVGNTSFVPSAVSDAVSDNKSCGYVVKTVGDTVYLLGKTANGTLYSVYGFLSEEFGFDYYFTDVYDLTTKSNLELKTYAQDVDPDIDMMGAPSAGTVQDNVNNKLRFNALNTAEIFIPLNGTTQTHNVFKIIPKDVYLSTHPKWYKDDGTTVCFAAHGDNDEYEAMQNAFLEVIKDGLKKSSANYCQIGQPDNCSFCNCSKCQELWDNSHYGQESGIMLQFCNDLCEKVYAWFDTQDGEHYRRDFKIMMLAYQDTRVPPLNISGYKVGGEYKVGVYVGFDAFGGSYPVNDTTNNTYISFIDGWAADNNSDGVKDITDLFMFWLYDINFEYYLYPYDTSVYKQDYYKKMLSVGAVLVNDQSQNDNSFNTTSWNNLKNYISCKLRWNVNADVAALTDKFFNACYKGGKTAMKAVYDSVLSRWATLRESATGSDKTALFSIFGSINQSKFWPLDTLKSWIAGMEDALAAIKTQLDAGSITETEYRSARKMICAEIISPLYMLTELYGSDRNCYTADEHTALKRIFRAYADEAGVDSAIAKYKDSGSPVYVG